MRKLRSKGAATAGGGKGEGEEGAQGTYRDALIYVVRALVVTTH
jgi:hypothetical protein